MKCQFCKQEERSYLWQPELGEHSFYLPGSHIRGFIALSIGDACKQRIQDGETLDVTHKKTLFHASLQKLERVETV